MRVVRYMAVAAAALALALPAGAQASVRWFWPVELAELVVSERIGQACCRGLGRPVVSEGYRYFGEFRCRSGSRVRYAYPLSSDHARLTHVRIAPDPG